MQKNTSFILGEHYERFLDEQVQSGRYGSKSEILRAGLRMLEEHETKLAALRHALIEGEESGTVDYDFKYIMDELDSEIL